MRTFINILLMGACFLSSVTLFARTDRDSFSLRIEGKILNAGLQGTAGCTIELLYSGQIVGTSVLRNPKKKFHFNLQKNRQYSLRISQQGYFDKVITINTEIPAVFEDAYGFLFETSLIEEKELEKLNRDVLLMPVAKISWDTKREYFYYDKVYSDNIRKELLSRNETPRSCPGSGQLAK